MALAPTSRSPRWYGIPLRILLITFLGTLICFAVSLLLAILGTVAAAMLRGVHPDMRIAYRQIAVPLVIVEAGAIFLLATVMEVRHYRQRKALHALERMG